MSDFEKLKTRLEYLGYTVKICESKEAARDYLCGAVSGKTVGFGGSVTLSEMGLYEALSVNNDVYWHWKNRDGMDGEAIRRAAMTTDIYFSSANAISENGEIVNIDGTCNRLAGTLYGHEKVYFVIGKNKIVKTLDDALYRAKNIAAPLNAKRLGTPNPCAKGDKCHGCDGQGRICRVTVIFSEKPTCADYEVVLVDEDLGY